MNTAALTRLCITLLLVFSGQTLLAAENAPSQTPLKVHEFALQASGTDEQASETEQPRRSSRLRFRNGPVCMCGDGLRESDIRSNQKNSTRRP